MSSLYFARTRDIAARALDGEMMIMSTLDSTLYNLNELGTLIWQFADGNTALDEIVSQKVCAEFEIEPGQAMSDAETFVRELAEHGLLTLSDQPIAALTPTRVDPTGAQATPRDRTTTSKRATKEPV